MAIFVFQSAVLRAETPPGPQLPLGCLCLNPCRTGTRLPSVAISRLPRPPIPCPTHRLAKSPSHSTPAPCRTRADKSSNGWFSWRSTAGLTSWKKAVAHLDPRDRQIRRAGPSPSRKQTLAGFQLKHLQVSHCYSHSLTVRYNQPHEIRASRRHKFHACVRQYPPPDHRKKFTYRCRP